MSHPPQHIIECMGGPLKPFAHELSTSWPVRILKDHMRMVPSQLGLRNPDNPKDENRYWYSVGADGKARYTNTEIIVPRKGGTNAAS